MSSLWIQDVQDREDTEFKKVLGTENPADMMTKYLTREQLDACLDKVRQVRQDGRASKGLELQGASVSHSGNCAGLMIQELRCEGRRAQERQFNLISASQGSSTVCIHGCSMN